MIPRNTLPLFPLGQVVATPGALDLGVSLLLFLQRHQRGDWGTLCQEDRDANDQALADGDRILSAYETGNGRIYIITESDRSITTILLPEEY